MNVIFSEEEVGRWERRLCLSMIVLVEEIEYLKAHRRASEYKAAWDPRVKEASRELLWRAIRNLDAN